MDSRKQRPRFTTRLNKLRQSCEVRRSGLLQPQPQDQLAAFGDMVRVACEEARRESQGPQWTALRQFATAARAGGTAAFRRGVQVSVVRARLDNARFVVRNLAWRHATALLRHQDDEAVKLLGMLRRARQKAAVAAGHSAGWMIAAVASGRRPEPRPVQKPIILPTAGV